MLNAMQNKRGSLMEAALVLPILSLIVFFTFDLAARQIVDHAAFAAAREAARSYAQDQSVSNAQNRASEAFSAQAGSLGTLQGVNIAQTPGFGGSYVEVEVTARPTVTAFAFAWRLLGGSPKPTIEKRLVFEIETTSGSGRY